ncbi:hypothetical protein KIPB_005441 [Kipferlia bialata]|uniref:Uncharacterized protein n=1 Tax=Kipferlia bialata TaxID=797122 RepID=A0A9K3CWP0_9EUKA|nr:hypothetical protein KIPB_001488 [Kipferlia bialata]GIQ84021.1 hypothetical protein KIPB_005441 [Kipferlia bialata]|eukprot:g1488.t1
MTALPTDASDMLQTLACRDVLKQLTEVHGADSLVWSIFLRLLEIPRASGNPTQIIPGIVAMIKRMTGGGRRWMGSDTYIMHPADNASSISLKCTGSTLSSDYLVAYTANCDSSGYPTTYTGSQQVAYASGTIGIDGEYSLTSSSKDCVYVKFRSSYSSMYGSHGDFQCDWAAAGAFTPQTTLSGTFGPEDYDINRYEKYVVHPGDMASANVTCTGKMNQSSDEFELYKASCDSSHDTSQATLVVSADREISIDESLTFEGSLNCFYVIWRTKNNSYRDYGNLPTCTYQAVDSNGNTSDSEDDNGDDDDTSDPIDPSDINPMFLLVGGLLVLCILLSICVCVCNKHEEEEEEGEEEEEESVQCVSHSPSIPSMPSMPSMPGVQTGVTATQPSGVAMSPMGNMSQVTTGMGTMGGQLTPAMLDSMSSQQLQMQLYMQQMQMQQMYRMSMNQGMIHPVQQSTGVSKVETAVEVEAQLPGGVEAVESV